MRKNVETKSTYCNTVILPLSSIRPQVFSRSAEIVWKAQGWNLFCFECAVHSFDSSVLAFEQSAVNPQCCAGCV